MRTHELAKKLIKGPDYEIMGTSICAKCGLPIINKLDEVRRNFSSLMCDTFHKECSDKVTDDPILKLRNKEMIVMEILV